MPGGKRTKPVVPTEHNDDDDFIATTQNTRSTRNTRSNKEQIEVERLDRQAPRKRKEKLSKIEQEELDLALKLSTETAPTHEVSTEISIISDQKENMICPSTVSNNEDIEHNENSLPKSKRMKFDVEEGNIDENKSDNEEDEEESEEEPTLRKKTRNSSIASIDCNSSRLVTRGQSKSSVSTVDPPKKTMNVPLGFPTSKIIIPTLQTSRVGLSRKVSVLKPLHPNLNQRTVHE